MIFLIFFHAHLGTVSNFLATTHKWEFLILEAGLTFGLIVCLEKVIVLFLTEFSNKVIVFLKVQIIKFDFLIFHEFAYSVKSVNSYYKPGLIFDIIVQSLHTEIFGIIFP